MKIQFESVPVEMQELPRWVLYQLKSSPDGKKPAKIPVDAKTGRFAKVNDPATWCDFQTALGALEAGMGDGLNFVHGADCPVVGVDLDHVRSPDTGEYSCQFSRAVVGKFTESGAYIEVSPSGTGIRIFCRGIAKHSGKGSKGFNNFELYGSGPEDKGNHTLSVTGSALQAVESLPVCQEALDWFCGTFFKKSELSSTSKTALAGAEQGGDRPSLSDSEILKLARRAKNGGKFKAVFDEGDLSEFGCDHSGADLWLCGALGFYTGDPEQVDRLFRQSALVRDKWTNRADYREATISKALEGLKAIYSPRRGKNDDHTQESFTEAALAKRFLNEPEAAGFLAERGGGGKPKVWGYDHKTGLWRVDGWGALMLAILTMARALRLEAVDTHSKSQRRRLNAAADRLETHRGCQDVAKLVGLHLEPVKPSDFDADNFKLKTQNGMLDLLTRKLLPDRPEWLASRSCDAVYDPQATCQLWEKVMLEVCCGDAELVGFLKRWFGYCLSGATSEQKMVFLFGAGENGKSLILRVVSQVLGDYAWTTPTDTLLQRRSEATNDLFALAGRRLVACSETESGQALAPARIKAMTGEPHITARPLYSEFSQIAVQFKLMMTTNDKPWVSDSSKGFWRRVLLVPMNAVFAQPDKNLPAKLEGELPGILNWLLDGFEEWRAVGLEPPEVVLRATNTYRQEVDTVGRFLADTLPNCGHEMKSGEFYRLFKVWCGEQGHHELTQVRFSQKLVEKGARKERRADGVWFCRLRELTF